MLAGAWCLEPALAESKVDPPSRNSPDEPIAASPSLARAAEFLDAVALDWTRTRQCGTCHTNYAYLLARPALREFEGPAMAEIRQFFEGRVAHWDDAEPSSRPRWDTEVVATASALAIHDAATTGTLHPTTRAALDRMWTLQRPDGAWDWLKCDWPPYEYDDYYGALFAALGVGAAPDGYARTEAARQGLERLRGFFRANEPPNLHHAAFQLWASQKLDGLMTPAQTGEDGRTTARPPATRRRLEPPLAGRMGPPRWHAQRRERPERWICDRPRRLRPPPDGPLGPGRADPARRRLAPDAPARLGPMVHAVPEQRQVPLHRQRGDRLRRPGPEGVRADGGLAREGATRVRRGWISARRPSYLPMQKRRKMRSRMSSVTTAPTTLPSSSTACRRSRATSSSPPPSSRVSDAAWSAWLAWARLSRQRAPVPVVGVAVGRSRLQRGGDGGTKLAEARAGLGAGRQGVGGEVRGGEVALVPDAEVSGSGLDRTSRGRCRTNRRRAEGRRGPPARRGGPAPGPRSGRCRARPRRCRSARRSGPRSRTGPTGSRVSSPPGVRPGPGAGR